VARRVRIPVHARKRRFRYLICELTILCLDLQDDAKVRLRSADMSGARVICRGLVSSVGATGCGAPCRPDEDERVLLGPCTLQRLELLLGGRCTGQPYNRSTTKKGTTRMLGRGIFSSGILKGSATAPQHCTALHCTVTARPPTFQNKRFSTSMPSSDQAS
jgi:hypothetical protein